MRSSAASASTSARRRVSFLSRAAVSGSRRLARYRSRMFFRRSAASRRTRSRSALNSSPCTYSLTRLTRASERSSEMISAEVCLKNLLATGFLLSLDPIVTSAGVGGRLPTLTLRSSLHIPENDASAGARAFEGRKIQAQIPGLPLGSARDLYFRAVRLFGGRTFHGLRRTQGARCRLPRRVSALIRPRPVPEELRTVFDGL